jgi:putative FmdB family regulatory protein
MESRGAHAPAGPAWLSGVFRVIVIAFYNSPSDPLLSIPELRRMPIFEYTCESCGHRFEYLTRASHEAACPACDSSALSKQLSTFAVRAPGAAPRADVAAPGPCGACGDPRGPGACSIN